LAVLRLMTNLIAQMPAGGPRPSGFLVSLVKARCDPAVPANGCPNRHLEQTPTHALGLVDIRGGQEAPPSPGRSFQECGSR
jgi:hypothetical protein